LSRDRATAVLHPCRLPPGMGAFSLFTDPEGRMMGLWKQAQKP
jgi:predicted enzyme related to lactoylglutathione lyase